MQGQPHHVIIRQDHYSQLKKFVTTKQTDKLNPNILVSGMAVPKLRQSDGLITYPLRIGAYLHHVRITLVFDLNGSIMFGRSSIALGSMPIVDLSPFNAQELGVSRHHLMMTRNEDHIAVTDNNSSNGSFLNDQRLEPQVSYPVHHGDKIGLGLLTMQIHFITDPFNF